MSIEQSYYENPEFWRPEAFLSEDHERLDFIVGKIPRDASSLLDVGCGNGLFLRRLNEKMPHLLTHGAERSKAALHWVEGEKTEASIDALPFEDRSFDVVSCLEVIEHLPVDTYLAALSELTRVAGRTLMISVPADQDLTLGRVECTACRSMFNPDFHWRSFDRSKMSDLLTSHGWRPIDITAYGLGLEYAGAKIITKLKRDRTNRYPQAIPCPSCGEIIPGRGLHAKMQIATTSSQSSGGMKEFIKSMWPKVSTNRWILGLYERY